MLKLLVVFIVCLILNEFCNDMIYNLLNNKLKEEGYFDHKYSLNSYKITSKLSSAEKKDDWREFYKGTQNVKITGDEKFDSPVYKFTFSSNLEILSDFKSLDNLEKIDIPFVKEVLFFLLIGKSVRFEVKDRILCLYTNDLFSPYKNYYLKDKFNIHDYKNYKLDTSKIPLKNGFKKEDLKNISDYELLVLHLANNLEEIQGKSSINSLLQFIDLELYYFVMTYENNKLIVWKHEKPILIVNLNDTGIKKIFTKFSNTYKASDIFKKILKSGTFYFKCKKDKIIIFKVDEVNTVSIILEFNLPELTDEEKKLKKENDKKNFKILAEFFENDKQKFELKLHEDKKALLKKLKALKKVKVDGKVFYFK